KRGVMNVNGTLPYFPYRDDGLLIWNKVGKLAKEYVNLYYTKAPEIDISVKFESLKIPLISAPISIITDIELQSFALQLNVTNIGPIPCGRFKDFPWAITTHEQLVDIVKRILFIPIQHSAINYPVSYYGASTANMPTKLYYPDTQDFSIHNLPIYNIAS
ncbi:arachidonate 5-lipoxygenase-like, partial [Paramuricea clavata]